MEFIHFCFIQEEQARLQAEAEEAARLAAEGAGSQTPEDIDAGDDDVLHPPYIPTGGEEDDEDDDDDGDVEAEDEVQGLNGI